MPRRGWSGPPPLLLVATVVLYAVAVLTSESDVPSPTPADSGARLTAGEPATGATSARTVPTPDATERADLAGRAAAASAPAPRRIGVATFNAYRDLTLEQTVADATTLARKGWVDVIGWQEAYRMGQVRPALRELGWRTAWAPGGSEELAISWRAEKFIFVGSDRRMVAPGVDPSTEYPVSNRYVFRVVLQDRRSGRRISIVNTHLPQAIEHETQPGRWRNTPNAQRARRQLEALARVFDNSPGRWVLGTGDMNLDARAERRAKPHRGPTRALSGHAVSSYQALGARGVPTTHPVTGRHIDYVYAATPTVKQDRVAFLRHVALDGFHSDHRPLLVRLTLT